MISSNTNVHIGSVTHDGRYRAYQEQFRDNRSLESGISNFIRSSFSPYVYHARATKPVLVSENLHLHEILVLLLATRPTAKLPNSFPQPPNRKICSFVPRFQLQSCSPRVECAGTTQHEASLCCHKFGKLMFLNMILIYLE